MVSVFVSSAVDRGFEFRWGQTKDYIIGIHVYCSAAKHAALSSKTKVWLARIRDNVLVERHVYPRTIVSVS
jgi:hypothetical protein